MKNILGSLRHAPLFAVTTAMSFGLAGQAMAQEDVNDLGGVARQISTWLTDVGQLILSLSFVAGLFFVGMGIMRLKAAVDSQGQQTKYGDGVWRIGLGAALIGLPAVIAIAQGSLGLEDGGTETLQGGQFEIQGVNTN